MEDISRKALHIDVHNIEEADTARDMANEFHLFYIPCISSCICARIHVKRHKASSTFREVSSNLSSFHTQLHEDVCMVVGSKS